MHTVGVFNIFFSIILVPKTVALVPEIEKNDGKSHG